MKRHLCWIAPLCFSIYPTLVVFVHNVNQLEINRLTTPLIYSFLVFVLFAFIAKTIMVNRQKTAILTTIWILLFFSYGYIYLYLGGLKLISLLPVSLNLFLLTLYLFIFVGTLYLLRKNSLPTNTICTYLNIVGLSLVIWHLAVIGQVAIRRHITSQQIEQHKSEFELVRPNFDNGEALKPDIYYIIFDRYARQDMLSNYYSFDNQPQVNYLRDKGFLVSESSSANYLSTFLSLSSSLNMTYLDFLADGYGKDDGDQIPVHSLLIEQNRVAQLLKSWGYSYVLAGNFWDPTRHDGISDENINIYTDFDEFHLFIFERTLLNVIRGMVEDNQIYTGVTRLEKMLINLDYQITRIANHRENSQPVFVFSHFLMPHEPNIFSATCEPLTFEEMRKQSGNEGYLNEIQCANQVMKLLVEKIQSRTNRPAVIIFQSDEGSNLPPDFSPTIDATGAITPEGHQIHAAILNAIYLPDKNNPSKPAPYSILDLPSNWSPVNTFRSIFNYYFDTNLPLLDDKTYYFLNASQPYHFQELPR